MRWLSIQLQRRTVFIRSKIICRSKCTVFSMFCFPHAHATAVYTFLLHPGLPPPSTPLLCSSVFSLRETPHTYLIIVISGLSVFESRSGLTAHVSHPCKQLIIRGVHTWLNMSPTNSGNYPHRHTSPSTSKPFSLTSINYYIEPLNSIVSPHLLFTPLHLR